MPAVTAEEEQALHTPIARRSAEQIDSILAMVKRSGFPVAPEREYAARVMAGVIVLEWVDEGEVLFEEGSESSDVYIVLSGSMNVCKKSVRDPINTVGPGKIFGEMALLHSDPVRHSSMVAAEDTQLARMGASDLVQHKVDLSLFEAAEQFYRDLQDQHDAQAAEQAGAFVNASLDVRKVMVTTKKPSNQRTIDELDHMLETMKKFKLFDEQTGKKFLQNVSQRRAVCAVLHCRTFEPGRYVCTEGEEGDTMYIVLYGRLAVSNMNAGTGESQHLTDLVAGQDFGELALLGDNLRTATVQASEFSVLLELQRPDYDATFRQADEEEIIEKVQSLTVCPLFNNMSLKKILRIAYGSEIMTFSKDQTILTEGVRSSRIYFVISGTVAVSTVCRTPSQTFLVSLGNRQSGSILGVETALSQDGQSNFTYVALSEVRLLACQTASITRRSTKEFMARLTEYAEACLSPAAVNKMVLVETDWVKTRHQHHLAATGLRPMPPPSLSDDEGRQGGAALRMASAQSLAKLVPQSMASLSTSIGQMTPRLKRAAGSTGSETPRLPRAASSYSSVGSDTPRLPKLGHAHSQGITNGGHGSVARRMNGSKSGLNEGDAPLVSEASLAMLATMNDAEVEIELVDRGMKDLKDRMGSLIELRDEQSGRSTPTPKDIAETPGEAYRRSLQMRLWDPLVRLNHLGRSEKQKEKEAEESRSSVNPAAAAARTEAALGGAPVVEVDLSRRLPKQFGMFTEMVYGVTVLWATVSCRTKGIVPGLAWHYFLNGLFKGFEEQAQMRGLMRSENREVSNESSFIIVGGMPHTKSYSQKPDGRNRAAGLVCDVAMRMIENVDASNKHHQNLLIELEHKAAIAKSSNQVRRAAPEAPSSGGQSPLASPRAADGANARSESGSDQKSFEVGIRIGISSGSAAINVFGTKSPVYFGVVGSEVDMARLLALAQPVVGGTASGSDNTDDTGSAHGSEPDGDFAPATAVTSHGTKAVLSNSTNELVEHGYLTSPATHLQKVDAQGNQANNAAEKDPSSSTANGTPSTVVATAGTNGDIGDPVLSGWILSGKKDSFDVGSGTATAAGTATATAGAVKEAPNSTPGTGRVAGGSAVRARNASISTGAKAVKARPVGVPLPGAQKLAGSSGAVRLSRSPRRPEHVFRAAQSELRASARCAPVTRQMVSPRMLSARLTTVSARVRPAVGARSSTSISPRSRSATRSRRQPSLRVVSPMSLYSRRPFGVEAGGL